jgi:hypothetical protein
MDDVFVCMGSVTFFVVLFGFIALMRYIGYRETLMLAEKGLVKPERRNGSGNGGGNGALVWGILITAVGMALCLGLLPIGFWVDRMAGGFPMLLGPWLLPGLVPMFFGVGLILIFVLTREPKPVVEKNVVVQETRFVPQSPITSTSAATVVEPLTTTTVTMTPPANPNDPPTL